MDEDCKKSELKPQSPYAESKLKEEEFLNKHKSSMSYICLRFGTIYGFSIGMRFHTAVNKFCWQAANNQQLTVWKTAFDQKRPYLDLKDACSSIIFLIQYIMEMSAPLRTSSSATKAVAIPIPKKPSSTSDYDEYSLKQSNFDPDKFSPPSSWNNRLHARLGNDSRYAADSPPSRS